MDEKYKRGYIRFILDGHNVRYGLNKKLGFSTPTPLCRVRGLGCGDT